jgi:hypothetical protein
MKPKAKIPQRQVVICVDNNDYAASLEIRKIYIAERDAKAESHGLVRIVDESGESYLYPKAKFRPIDLPESIKKALSLKPAKRPVRIKKAISKKSEAA